MRVLAFFVFAGSLLATPVLGPGVDASEFRITLFASGLGFPQSMLRLPDGSLAVQTSPGFSGGTVLRFVDANADGIADGPGVPLYTAPVTSPAQGPLTQMVQAGSHVIQGNYGDRSIVILETGPTPDAPWSEVGRMEFSYPGALWWHDTLGLAIRPAAGEPSVYDLVFNVGSQFDNIASTDSVGLSNLIDATLNPDSLYMVTLDLRGPSPTASNLVQVAAGIRNVFGMGFDADGNLWFTDNAMDGSPFPPQAEELNMIPLATLNGLQSGDPGALVPDFGFPNCFPEYFTGIHASPGCVEPVVSFVPLSGTEFSQGATQLAFAPGSFPAAFANGIFIAFAGNPPGDRNPLIFFNTTTQQYQYFLLGGTGTLRQTGLLATEDSLFVSDFLTGEIYQISTIPEPAAAGLLIFGLLALACARYKLRLPQLR